MYSIIVCFLYILLILVAYSIMLCHCIIKIHRVHKIILNWLVCIHFPEFMPHANTHTLLVVFFFNVDFVIEWLDSFININISLIFSTPSDVIANKRKLYISCF